MRHIDHGAAERLVQLGNFDAHLHAQFRIEVGERFVEEEDFRLAHDGAADGDTLALAAGKRLRLALQQRADLQDIGGLLHPCLDFRFFVARRFQPEGEVLVDAHMRIERVGLEDHGDAALGGSGFVDPLTVDTQIAFGDFLKPGDHAQKRGFATARRADEDGEFARLDLEIDAVDDRKSAEPLDDFFERNAACHAVSPDCRAACGTAATVLIVLEYVPDPGSAQRFIPVVAMPSISSRWKNRKNRKTGTSDRLDMAKSEVQSELPVESTKDLRPSCTV